MTRWVILTSGHPLDPSTTAPRATQPTRASSSQRPGWGIHSRYVYYTLTFELVFQSGVDWFPAINWTLFFVSQLDGRSFFWEQAPAAEGTVSGIITLLAAIQALSPVTQEAPPPRNIFFTFFQGVSVWCTYHHLHVFPESLLDQIARNEGILYKIGFIIMQVTFVTTHCYIMRSCDLFVYRCVLLHVEIKVVHIIQYILSSMQYTSIITAVEMLYE